MKYAALAVALLLAGCASAPAERQRTTRLTIDPAAEEACLREQCALVTVGTVLEQMQAAYEQGRQDGGQLGYHAGQQACLDGGS